MVSGACEREREKNIESLTIAFLFTQKDNRKTPRDKIKKIKYENIINENVKCKMKI